MTAPNPSLFDRLGHWAKSDTDKRFDADFHLKYLARSSHEHTELVRREVSLLEAQGRRNEERFLALEKTGVEIAGLRGDLESYKHAIRELGSAQLDRLDQLTAHQVQGFNLVIEHLQQGIARQAQQTALMHKTMDILAAPQQTQLLEMRNAADKQLKTSLEHSGSTHFLENLRNVQKIYLAIVEDPKGMGALDYRTWFQLGLLYGTWFGEFDRAKNAFHNAQRLSEGKNNPAFRAESLRHLAEMHHRLGEGTLAWERIIESIQTYPPDAAIHARAALYAAKLNLADAAREHLHEALRMNAHLFLEISVHEEYRAIPDFAAWLEDELRIQRELVEREIMKILDILESEPARVVLNLTNKITWASEISTTAITSKQAILGLTCYVDLRKRELIAIESKNKVIENFITNITLLIQQIKLEVSKIELKKAEAIFNCESKTNKAKHKREENTKNIDIETKIPHNTFIEWTYLFGERSIGCLGLMFVYSMWIVWMLLCGIVWTGHLPPFNDRSLDGFFPFSLFSYPLILFFIKKLTNTKLEALAKKDYQNKLAAASKRKETLEAEYESEFSKELTTIEKEKAQALADFERNIEIPRENLARYQQWRDEFHRVVERAELAG